MKSAAPAIFLCCGALWWIGVNLHAAQRIPHRFMVWATRAMVGLVVGLYLVLEFGR